MAPKNLSHDLTDTASRKLNKILKFSSLLASRVDPFLNANNSLFECLIGLGFIERLGGEF